MGDAARVGEGASWRRARMKGGVLRYDLLDHLTVCGFRYKRNGVSREENGGYQGLLLFALHLKSLVNLRMFSLHRFAFEICISMSRRVLDGIVIKSSKIRKALLVIRPPT